LICEHASESAFATAAVSSERKPVKIAHK
jgi:hypothetical protein